MAGKRTLAVEILEMDDLRIRVSRKAVKNMYLRIKPPDGRIEITAPVRTSHRRIEEFVRSRRTWIVKSRKRILDHAARFNAVDGAPGADGRNANGSESGTNTPTPARPPFGQPWTAARKTQAKRIINARLPELLRKWTPIIGKSPTNISLRAMTSRWGSCTPATGRIRLNLELAYLPERYLEYVLVHELTHLWERNHGEGFRRRMTAYLPEWRRLRRELNQLV